MVRPALSMEAYGALTRKRQLRHHIFAQILDFSLWRPTRNFDGMGSGGLLISYLQLHNIVRILR